MNRKIVLAVFLIALLMLGAAHTGHASRFSLFALDVQVPLAEGQSVGEVRKTAIDKGLEEAVEEATYKIIPDQGLDTTYQKLKQNIFDKARDFIPQYKILGEKRFPETFDLSLQVTVDTVLLRRALLKLGLLKAAKEATSGPVVLEIQNLVDGKTLMEIMGFFNQRMDLAEDFTLVTASHGTFTFSLIPLQPLKEIASQILYQAQISRGTFEVVTQEKGRLVLRYHPANPS